MNITKDSGELCVSNLRILTLKKEKETEGRITQETQSQSRITELSV